MRLKIFQMTHLNVFFFGDKVIEGGNDYSIAMMCGKYYDVSSPEDTLIILEEYR